SLPFVYRLTTSPELGVPRSFRAGTDSFAPAASTAGKYNRSKMDETKLRLRKPLFSASSTKDIASSDQAMPIRVPISKANNDRMLAFQPRTQTWYSSLATSGANSEAVRAM